jgi:hypothetical protein
MGIARLGAVDGGGEKPRRSLLASQAALTGGLLAFVFGLMGTMLGGMFLGMCLIGGGILCDGTLIGVWGYWASLLGLPLLIVGVLLFIPARRRMRREQQEAVARIQDEQLARAVTALDPGAPLSSATGPRGPIASKCPECGGPVEPGSGKCPWCGQPFA